MRWALKEVSGCDGESPSQPMNRKARGRETDVSETQGERRRAGAKVGPWDGQKGQSSAGSVPYHR